MSLARNIIITALGAALLLPSCQKKESPVLPVTASGAVGFSVYAGSVSTKGTEVLSNDICGASSSAGIGVFAFMQPNVNGTAIDFNSRRFTTPDFMYNQMVGQWTDGTPGSWSWSYSPVKYWPTEMNDQVSFFAYAPYRASTSWEDLSVSTNAAGTVLTASVPVYDIKSDMQDVLWADPQLNVRAPAPLSPVGFTFRHLLSKVSIMTGVDDGTSPAGPKAWTDPNTVISIDRIVFTSLSDSYNLSCQLNPVPTAEVWKASWKAGSATQDVTLVRNSDFDADSSLISSAHYTGARYCRLLRKEDGKEGFLFLAPQSFTAGVQTVSVTYTVVTTDALNPSKNSSSKTNTITKDLNTILPSGLESGRAYVLKFLLSPGSVSLSGNVTGWDTADEHSGKF